MNWVQNQTADIGRSPGQTEVLFLTFRQHVPLSNSFIQEPELRCDKSGRERSHRSDGKIKLV